MDKYQRIKSMFKKFKFNAVFLLILSYLLVFSSLSADTLDEILRLTYSSNKQLIFSRTNLASVEKSIAISESSLGVNFSASINGAKAYDINQSSQSDNYSSSITGSYNLFDGNFSKNKVLLEKAFYDIAKIIITSLGSNSEIITTERKGRMPHEGYRAFENKKVKDIFANFSFKSFKNGVNYFSH